MHRHGFLEAFFRGAAYLPLMLDHGERPSVRIVKLKHSRNPLDRVRFEVVLDG